MNNHSLFIFFRPAGVNPSLEEFGRPRGSSEKLKREPPARPSPPAKVETPTRPEPPVKADQSCKAEPPARPERPKKPDLDKKVR